MATGDSIFSEGTQVTAITGGATRASGVYSTSGEVTALSSNTAIFGDATLSCSFTVAPVAGEKVSLFRRDINIDSTNDAAVPASGRPEIFMGTFTVLAVTTQQFMSLPSIPLFSGDQEFYIRNDTSQTMDADYLVKIKPMHINQA